MVRDTTTKMCGFSPSEVAKFLGMSVREVKETERQALRKLKNKNNLDKLHELRDYRYEISKY